MKKILVGPEYASSTFQSWDWNRLWCKHVLAQNKKAFLDVHIITDSRENIVAILPFFKTSLVGQLLRITQFLGHRMSVRYNILISEPDNKELVAQIVDLMIDGLGRNDLLHLRHLPNDVLFTKTLIDKGIATPQCKKLWITNDPDITNQLMRLRGSSRKKLSNTKNRLERNHSCKVEISTADTLAQAFDNWYILHEKRWKSMNRQTTLSGYNFDFLKVITLLSGREKNFEILSLLADDKIIAARLLVNDGVRCFAYQTGFDPEFSRYSPLKILMAELLHHAFEDLHCEIVDFGPGYEQNKYEWSPTIDLNYSCCVGGKGIYIKAITTLYRYAFHKSLPPI